MNTLTRTYERIVLYQTQAANILDLGPRKVKSISGPQREEDRTENAAGGTTVTGRQHQLTIPLTAEEEARFARLICDGVGCACGAWLLGKQGAEHWGWLEPVRPGMGDGAGRSVGSVGDRAITLQSQHLTPAIGRGRDLIEAVPWVGTSAQPSLQGTSGITVANNGRLAVIDDVAGEVVLFNRFDGQVVDRFSTTIDQPDLTYDAGRREFIISDGVSELSRYDLNGNLGDVIKPEDQSGSPLTGGFGVTIGDGDLILQDDSDTIYRYDGVPKGGNITATGELSITTDTVTPALTHSGNLISLGVDSSGTRQVREHNGTFDATSSVVLTDDAIRGLATIRGDLMTALDGDTTVSPADLPIRRHDGITGNVEESFDAGRRQPLIPGGIQADRKPGYDGPYWRHVAGGNVNILGETTGITNSDPAFLQFVFPVPGAEIRLEGVTGALDGLDFGGTAININDSSRIGSPPQLLLEGGKYSGLGINSSGVWYVRARIDSAAAIPQLVVVDPSTPRGVRRGGVVSDCSQRITSPKWGAPVETVAFDIDASAGDGLTVSVTEAPGTDNYVGQISGDGESIKGESATFDYANAGTFTAEMVAQPDFEGVTEADLRGPIDLSTLGDLGKLADATRFIFRDGAGTLFNELPASAIPSSLTTVNAGGNFKASLTTLSSVAELRVESTDVFGDFGDLGTHTIFNIGRSSGPFSGTLNGTPFNNNTTKIALNRLSDGSASVDLTSIMSAATAVETFSTRGVNANDLSSFTGTLDEVLRGSSALVAHRSQSSTAIGGDFSGASLGPDVEQLLFNNTSVVAPPDDFSNAQSLSFLLYSKGSDSQGDFNASALDNTIQNLHANRSVWKSNNPKVGFKEANKGQLRSTKSDVSLDRLIGLGNFHPFNGGEGIIDVGATLFNEREVIQIGLDSFDLNGGGDGAGSVTFTVSFKQRSGGNPKFVDRVSGSEFQFDEGADKNNLEWTDWLYDGSGSGHPQDEQQFRLIGPSGQDRGLYEVLTHSATALDQNSDGTDDAAEVTVEVQGSPSTSAQSSLDSNLTTDASIVFYAQPATAD